ncbi:MAG: hypothetical protein N2690_01910 [Rhodocyclaceae bacterium]|nr:hypothetical protein [Rhodocyclaceae bacterium]
MNEGLAAMQAWRSQHWGMTREPHRIRWLRPQDGSFVLVASGGCGSPQPLAKQLSLDGLDLQIDLAEADRLHGESGWRWRAGKRSALDAVQVSELLNMAGLCVTLPF